MNDAERDNLFQLGQKLFDRKAEVRIRAALDLGEHAHAHKQLQPLIDALDDRDRAVREVVFDALDRIIAAHPEALEELVKRATNEERPPIIGLARYLVHVGTPAAIEGALATIVSDADTDEHAELFELLLGATSLTNERLQAMVDADGEDEMRRMAAELLGRRGVMEGYRSLFVHFGTRRLFEQFIQRGRDGIRALACAFPHFDDSDGLIAGRIAAHRDATEGTIHELIAEGPSSDGLRTAVEVLGYWDEPRHVEILMKLAQDRAQDGDVREEAIVSLCRLQAPEAIDLLVRTLLDHEEADWLRWDCAKALGEIGQPAALQALESVVKDDPDNELRNYARDAIEVIRGAAG